MSLRISTNVDAFNAYRNLNGVQSAMSSSMEKLSSGYRINRGADDAAGLGISESMRSQIRGLAQAQKNIQDGVSLVQTAEGNLNQVHSMLQRVRELAVKYGNGTNSAEARTAIQNEVNQLSSEISRVQSSAKFNGIALLSSTAVTTSFQVGADDGQTISVNTGGLSTISSFTLGGTNTLASIDAAITAVSTQRSELGAIQNRLSNAYEVTGAYQENMMAAESRIRDVDMADEMVKFVRSQILSQAGQSMLSQANQAPQQVLQLIR